MEKIFKSYRPDAEPSIKERIGKDAAEEAVRTLIRWIGDNPNREGLLDTPKRVIKSFEEHIKPYKIK